MKTRSICKDLQRIFWSCLGQLLRVGGGGVQMSCRRGERERERKSACERRRGQRSGEDREKQRVTGLRASGGKPWSKIASSRLRKFVCVWVCVYICVCACIYMCVYYIYVYMFTHISISISIYIYIYIHIYMYIYRYRCRYRYRYIYMCVYIYLHICMYVHI